MNPQVERPVVGRAQVLILAALGAAFWIVLSLFGASNSASAAEGNDPQEGLLGTVTGSVDALPVVSAVVEAPAVEAPAVEVPAAEEPAAVPTVAAVAEAVDEVTTDPVGVALSTVQTTVTAVGQTLQPILDQPLVATTADLLTGSVDTAAAALRQDAVPALSAETAEPGVAGFASPDSAMQQEPPVAITVGHDAPLPSAPLTPVSPDATPTSPTSSGHPLMAAIIDSSANAAFAAVTGFMENDVVPSSPTYDTDCSPD